MNAVVSPDAWFSFRKALTLAIVIHIVGLVLYALQMHLKPLDVPVTLLRIKIGDPQLKSSEQTHMKSKPLPPQKITKPQQKPKPPVKKIVNKPVPTPMPKKVLQPVLPLPVTKPIIADPIPVQPKKMFKPPQATPSQESLAGIEHELARDVFMPGGAKGSEMGNKKQARQEIINSYTELLSRHMARHKVYPRSAKKEKIEGKGVVYLHIGRNGDILSSALHERTGHPILDDAIMSMVEKANPAPVFPDKWHDDEWGFLIPIIFD